MKADSAKIRSSGIGSHLDEQQAAALARLMSVRELHDGDVLVREGEQVDTLFLLVDGALNVQVAAHGHADLVHTMRPGECAGTRAFVAHSPRAATVSARGDATVYAIEPEALEATLATDPKLVYAFMRGLVTATHANLARMYQESEQLTNYVMRMHGRY